MTKKEKSIEMIKAAFDVWEEEYGRDDDWSEEHEARDMAIKALEQEPCEDCVSRKAVLNLAKDLEFSKIKGMENYKHRCIEIEDVEELPSVMPDLSSLREINEALTKRVQFLETMNKYATPVAPTRKKGKWIKIGDRGFGYTDTVICKCSECEYKTEFTGKFNGQCLIVDMKRAYKYCPNCGAEMESEE